MAEENTDMKQMAATVRQLVNQMIANGRADLALQAIGMSNLELLRLEAARAQLSRLLITSDYRFLLPDNLRRTGFPAVSQCSFDKADYGGFGGKAYLGTG